MVQTLRLAGQFVEMLRRFVVEYQRDFLDVHAAISWRKSWRNPWAVVGLALPFCSDWGRVVQVTSFCRASGENNAVKVEYKEGVVAV